jgi:hypothetical protein
MFTHELAPVAGSLTVSALIALLPLITIFILLGVVRIKAHWGVGLAGGRRDPPTKTRPSDVTAAIRLACARGRTHEQCRGIVIDPDSLAVQLWAMPRSTDSELLGSHRCVHRPPMARVWPRR